MAIAFSQTVTALNSGASSTSHSFTGNGLASVSAVTNGIAFVLYDCAGVGVDPLTVTWGGQPMTKIATLNQTIRGNTQSLWYILRPSSGAVTVADTFSVANTPNMIWATYSGVRFAPPEALQLGEVKSALNLGVSVTTITPNAWVIGAFTNSSGAATAGANTTSRFSNVLAIGDSNASIATPSSQAQNWSFGSNSNWTGFAVSIAPYVQADNNFFFFS